MHRPDHVPVRSQPMPEERGTVNDLEPRFYPNLIGRLYLISLEDVMGRNGVNALLNLSGARNLVNSYPPSNLKREFPFAELTTISKATETMYGPPGARGMAHAACAARA